MVLMKEKMVSDAQFAKIFENVIYQMYQEYSDQPFFEGSFSQVIVSLIKDKLINHENLKFFTKKGSFTDEDEREEYLYFTSELIKKMSKEASAQGLSQVASYFDDQNIEL